MVQLHVIIGKGQKWEGEAKDKSDKLTRDASKLNDLARLVAKLEKAEVDLEARNHKVLELKETNEKAKHKLSSMTEKLTFSMEIGYGLAMNFFKK